MTTRHGLLYLSAEVDRLYRVDGNTLTEVEADSPFQALTVVSDHVEESLVRASLPRMFGRDMQALVKRRLEQEFRETPYRASARLGVSRNDKQLDYLFIGLPIARRLDERLRPWVERGVAIRGLYTLSALAAHWADRGNSAEGVRLVLLPTPAGVRFILLDRGQAVLSRLTSVERLDDPRSGRALVEELERTLQYFYNARLVERGQRIDLWLWGDQPACRELAARELTGLQVAAGPADRRLGDPAIEGMACLLRLAATHPPSEQLAPDPIRRFYALAQLRRVLLAGGVALSLLLGGFAAGYAVDSWQLRRNTQLLQQQIAQVEGSLGQLRARADSIDVEPATVSESIRSFDRYLAGLPALRPTLVAASRAFDQEPEYRLELLRWDVLDPPRIDPLTGTPPEQSGEGCPRPWKTDPETGETPAGARAGLALRGEVTGEAPLREVLAARQRFEERLRAVPGFELQTQAAAVDASGSGVLRGGGEQRGERSFDYCLSAGAS
jgi:hypothetical protein